jgi:hypothetical protein
MIHALSGGCSGVEWGKADNATRWFEKLLDTCSSNNVMTNE